jgi:DNA invertase Pin-like site-specific DNA recombinase
MKNNQKEVTIDMCTNDPGNETRPQRAAIYARSATKDQVVTGMSNIDQQIVVCRQYCAEHDYTLEEQHIYHEIVGGKEYKGRPQFTSLHAAAKEHQFDILVVFSIDRLARDLQYRTMLLEELTQVGITVKSVDSCGQDDVMEFIQATYEQVAQIQRHMRVKRMQYAKSIKKAQPEQNQ